MESQDEGLSVPDLQPGGSLHGLAPDHHHHYKPKMKASLFLISSLVALSMASPSPKNDLTCSICVDVITDLDNWLTADTTMEEIKAFTHQICAGIGSLLGEAVEAQCNKMFDDNPPAIINALVNDNLDPQQVCDMIKL